MASSVAYSWTVWEWWWDTIAGFGSLRSGRGALVADAGIGVRRKERLAIWAKQWELRCGVLLAQAGTPAKGEERN